MVRGNRFYCDDCGQRVRFIPFTVHVRNEKGERCCRFVCSGCRAMYSPAKNPLFVDELVRR